VIALSTAAEVRRDPRNREPAAVRDLPNESTSPLFQAAAEATEEAILNSLFRATTTTANGTTIDALPLDRTLEVLRRYGALGWDQALPPGRP
jgi:D-aminopeptidase